MTTGPESPERDPALERAWRAHSREGPPAELDRAILAAAHRAVGSGPAAVTPGREANRPQRWWMPLAAAATIGAVAVGLLQMSPRDESIVAPTERVAAVAPQRELGKAAPAGAQESPAADAGARATPSGAPAAAAPAVGAKVRAAPDAPARPAGNEGAAVRELDAPAPPPAPPPAPQPATAPPLPAAPPAPMADARGAPAAPPAPTASSREAPAVFGKLAERTPEPFPAAPAARSAASAEMKRVPPAADAAAPAAIAQAPREEQASAPVAAVEQDKRELARKDVAEAERRQAAAPPPAARGPGPAAAGASSSPAAPAPPPQPPAAAMRTRENAFVRDAAREQAAPAAVAKGAAPAQDARMKARDPDAWIAQIRKLRDEGRNADAIRELRDFRELVPDADRRIPEDLRELASSIRP